VHATFTNNVSNKSGQLGCREFNSEQNEHQQNSITHHNDSFSEENLSEGFFCYTLYTAVFWGYRRRIAVCRSKYEYAPGLTTLQDETPRVT